MASYREQLPQLSGELFLTDGGLETDLIFNYGLDLPLFAAIDVIRTEEGRASLEHYFGKFLDIARRHNTGFVLESATWRASSDWSDRLGYRPGEMVSLNERAIDMLSALRDRTVATTPIVVSGCVGPRGDGYDPTLRMTADEAAEYHAEQVSTFASSSADQVTAITMNYVEEAVGVARAAASAGMPSVISFTVETDGRLPTGQALAEAIDQVDGEGGAAPAYYMINCAHPTHFEAALATGEVWTSRIHGVRGNASKMSHAELDDATDLDDGNPRELGQDYGRITAVHPQMNVLGGCCGTDHRHVEAIARACGRSAVDSIETHVVDSPEAQRHAAHGA